MYFSPDSNLAVQRFMVLRLQVSDTRFALCGAACQSHLIALNGCSQAKTLAPPQPVGLNVRAHATHPSGWLEYCLPGE
jgi:hypothetical protein